MEITFDSFENATKIVAQEDLNNLQRGDLLLNYPVSEMLPMEESIKSNDLFTGMLCYARTIYEESGIINGLLYEVLHAEQVFQKNPFDYSWKFQFANRELGPYVDSKELLNGRWWKMNLKYPERLLDSAIFKKK